MADDLKTVKDLPNITRWNLDDGYETVQKNNDEYPRRVFGTSLVSNKGSMLQILTAAEDLTKECKKIDGFGISVNLPGEVPISNEYFTLPMSIPLLEVSRIKIKPKVIFTSDDVRKYNPNRRYCYYNFERKLYFFKIYTVHNCVIECIANFTKQECGCIKFHTLSNIFSFIHTIF